MRGIGDKIDYFLLFIVILLTVSGFFIFFSASLGLLARESVNVNYIISKQLIIGIGLGIPAMFFFSKIHYKYIKKYSIHFFIFALILSALVFIPGVGFKAGGAVRWIALGPITLQPAEILKVATVIFFASYLANFRKDLDTHTYSWIAYIMLLIPPVAILYKQPDISTVLVMGAATFSMFIAAGVKWKYIGIFAVVSLLALSGVAFSKGYIQSRLSTYIHPGVDIKGDAYQSNQLLITTGSGRVAGRGFGKGIQKFGHLPEPIGDSIFSVASEEFGFLGSLFIVILFILLGWRGLFISARAPDYFSALLVTGIIMLILAQAFINISVNIGLFPTTGLPLPFISHGGTALLILLAGLGIVLNVSKYMKKT